MALDGQYQTYILTLTGSPQELQSLIAGSGRVIWAELTALRTNSNPIYHAGQIVSGGALSSTNYGGYIPAPTGGVPVAPYRYDGHNGRLDNVQVLGTNTEKLCLNVRVLI